MADFLKKPIVANHTIDPESVRLLPQVFCFSSSVVVLGEVDLYAEDPILIGIADAKDLATVDTVTRRFAPRRVKVIELGRAEVTKALNLAYGISVTAPDEEIQMQTSDPSRADGGAVPESERIQVSTNVKLPEDFFSRVEAAEPAVAPERQDRSVISIVNRLLLDSLRRGATDIHLENERRQVTVRYKLDGLLHKVKSALHKDNVDQVVNRLKVMAELDISEHRAPQDGRILLRTVRRGRDYDVPFRISVLPGPYGEEIVLRVLDKSMAPISLELLGFTSGDLKTYRRLTHNPQGMILVTGPTGSGKTTTLYATLKEISSPHIKILSAEDPIEYNLEGVNQKQVTEKFGFADMARAFLRHDPDVLLIGEIRDEDTADVACKAAQTGHLILSTLHTNDSISSISRLNVLGLNYELIGSSLLGVLSQRLVRRVCPRCKEEYQPDEETLENFKGFLQLRTFVRGRGCDNCTHTGFRGRIGIFELLLIDDELQSMIFEKLSLDLILEASLERGMTPLIFDGLRKVEQHYTTIEELVRVIPFRQIKGQLKRKTKYLPAGPEEAKIVEGGVVGATDLSLPQDDADSNG